MIPYWTQVRAKGLYVGTIPVYMIHVVKDLFLLMFLRSVIVVVVIPYAVCVGTYLSIHC